MPRRSASGAASAIASRAVGASRARMAPRSSSASWTVPSASVTMKFIRRCAGTAAARNALARTAIPLTSLNAAASASTSRPAGGPSRPVAAAHGLGHRDQLPAGSLGSVRTSASTSSAR